MVFSLYNIILNSYWIVMFNKIIVIFSKGRRQIQALATALRLSDHLMEAAQRYFNLAITNNFIQGRKTQLVVAACLYIVCRTERTSHMLIDFSDILQVNKILSFIVYGNEYYCKFKDFDFHRIEQFCEIFIHIIYKYFFYLNFTITFFSL